MRLTVWIGIAIGLVAVLALAGWPASSYIHVDFIGFWAAARALVLGLDPYDVPTWQSLIRGVGSLGVPLVPRDTGFGYPLSTAVFAIPIGALEPALAAPVWLVAQVVAASVALVALARQLYRRPYLRRDALLLLGLAAAFQPAWSIVLFGNVGGFLLAAVSGGTALLLGGRPLAAGMVLGFLVVKPHPFLLFAPALIAVTRGRTRVRLGAGAVLVAGLLVALSFALRPDWVEGWLRSGVRLSALGWRRANGWGLAPDAAPWLGALVVAGAALGFLVWWLRRRPAPVWILAAALPLSLVASPYLWSHDQLTLLVSVAIAIAGLAGLPRLERAIGLTLLAAIVVGVAWLAYVPAVGTAEEPLAGLTPLGVLASVIAIELRAPRARASDDLAPQALLAP